MRVSVVGAGYAGLVTAACLAEHGHEVVCADVDRAKVDDITAGRSPIFEPGLEELVKRWSGTRLRATVDIAAAVVESELTLLTVGTPSTETGIDLGAVTSATRTIAAALGRKNGYHVVAVKSTVVPGTTDQIVRPLLEESGRSSEDLGVGVNPEFLTEGRAVADFLAPDRLVLGGSDKRTHAVLCELYSGFPSSVPRLLTNTRTAEMIKYASNALLATMISFANEIGNLSATVGQVDAVDVMRGVHLSQYLTLSTQEGGVRAPIAAYLEAGCGFGGSCLPKDVRALVAEGERLQQPMRVLRAVIDTNDAQPDVIVRLIEQATGDLRGKRVTALGLAFKPDTDDTRESPTIPIVERLLRRGAVVTIHDPVVAELPMALRRRDIRLSSELEATLASADAIILLTSWDSYWKVPSLLRRISPQPIFVDGRRMLERAEIQGYVGVGLG